MPLDQLKQQLAGEWISIAPELRPSGSKNADGSLKPFYLTRRFTYSAEDVFALEIINFADAYGQIPLANIKLKGHISWQGEHPIIMGAQQVDFTASQAYDVTPLHPAFIDTLNKVATDGYDAWQLNTAQSVFQKAFLPFGLTQGQLFKEYDLIFVQNNLMFWGARHVDGRGFDTPENRPTNLQIPLIRRA